MHGSKQIHLAASPHQPPPSWLLPLPPSHSRHPEGSPALRQVARGRRGILRGEGRAPRALTWGDPLALLSWNPCSAMNLSQEVQPAATRVLFPGRADAQDRHLVRVVVPHWPRGEAGGEGRGCGGSSGSGDSFGKGTGCDVKRGGAPRAGQGSAGRGSTGKVVAGGEAADGAKERRGRRKSLMSLLLTFSSGASSEVAYGLVCQI